MTSVKTSELLNLESVNNTEGDDRVMLDSSVGVKTTLKESHDRDLSVARLRQNKDS